MATYEIQRAAVDGIPLMWIEPALKPVSGARRFAIWLPPFAGSKESTEPQLIQLAQRGFVALSFDPYQHGERRVETQDELISRVVGNIRRHFWPILAYSAQEVLRVIDFAVDSLRIDGDICLGGFSMGGDIAVAAAGMDRRINRVSVCGATPDWMRPGSIEPPGEPDSLAKYLYENCDPLSNVDRYWRCPAISFQCGAKDRQVPAEGALEFIQRAGALYRDCPERLQFSAHEEAGHAFTDAMWANCLNWFSDNSLKPL